MRFRGPQALTDNFGDYLVNQEVSKAMLVDNLGAHDAFHKNLRSWKQIWPFNRILYCIPIGSSCKHTGFLASPE